MNARSSRGHGIGTLRTSEVGADGGEQKGLLTLVDLAGMESSKKSFSVEGASSVAQRREEAKHINTSLFALSGVVSELAKRGPPERKHVPCAQREPSPRRARASPARAAACPA